MTEITKKQYILSSQKLDVDMRENRVGDLFLYTDERLKLTKLETANGTQLWLLGNAFCTHKELSAEDDARAFSGDDITDLTRNWTGRWAVVSETELFTDATGLMSAFYCEDTTLVSSSLAVLSRVLDRNAACRVEASALNWQILPDTTLDGVKKLTSTQKLIFENGRCQVRFNNWITDCRHLSAEEKCQKTADILTTAVKNINAFSGKRIVLALTGGKDSRLTLSALLNAKVPFEAYTAEHERLSKSDKTVPKKLASAFGFEHRLVKRQPLNREILSDYYNFSFKNSKGADASFYACNQFAPFSEDALILRSGLFEAAQCYARGYTKPDTDGFFASMLSHYKLETKENQTSALKDWISSVDQNPIEYIDLRDRFYIEQRVGGWAAAIEQSFDIADFTSIQIANCAELLSVFLSCNDEERKNLSIAYGTSNILKPEVMKIPFNRSTLSDKVKIIARALKKRLKRR